MNLEELQQHFSKLINDPISRPPSTLSVSGPAAAEQLLQIYRNNFYLSLQDYLSACFPVTEALVGEPFFQQMARDYIQRHPLNEAPLENYAELFPHFISLYQAAEALPYLRFIAQLEQQIDKAAGLNSPQVFPFQRLQALPVAQQEQLTFHCAPGVSAIHAPYPILSIWHSVTNQNTEQLEQLDMNTEERVLVYPASPDTAHYQLLTTEQYRLFSDLMLGNPLSECLHNCRNHPAFDPQQHLQQWISLGVINDFQLCKEPVQ